jgi:hypothetical protein
MQERKLASACFSMYRIELWQARETLQKTINLIRNETHERNVSTKSYVCLFEIMTRGAKKLSEHCQIEMML